MTTMAEQPPAPQPPRRSREENTQVIRRALMRFGIGDSALEEYLPSPEVVEPVEELPDSAD